MALSASDVAMLPALRAPSLQSIQLSAVPEHLVMPALLPLALARPRPVVGGQPRELAIRVVPWGRRHTGVSQEQLARVRSLVDAAGRGGWVRLS